MAQRFAIEPLGTHDRTSFSCGALSLDQYFRTQASQDMKRLVASCFVAVDIATRAVGGYYTLAATSIPATELPPDTRKLLPRYPSLPAALIGRLAIAQTFHRQGLGSALLADAALRVLKGDTAAFALVVEAKDESAVAFYQVHGFRRFISRPVVLFLPLATAKKATVSARPG